MSGSATGVFAAHSEYLDRWVQVGIASGNVIRVTFPDSQPSASDGHNQILDRLIAYLDEGHAGAFGDVEIALTVPTDHRRVYETVRTIPYGTERTVEEVVARTAVLEPGEDGTAAVRAALANNPIPIVIPGHRVQDVPDGTDAPIRRHLRALEELP